MCKRKDQNKKYKRNIKQKKETAKGKRVVLGGLHTNSTPHFKLFNPSKPIKTINPTLTFN